MSNLQNSIVLSLDDVDSHNSSLYINYLKYTEETDRNPTVGKCQRPFCRFCRWSDQVVDFREQKKTKEFSLTAGRLGAKQ